MDRDESICTTQIEHSYESRTPANHQQSWLVLNNYQQATEIRQYININL